MYQGDVRAHLPKEAVAAKGAGEAGKAQLQGAKRKGYTKWRGLSILSVVNTYLA